MEGKDYKILRKNSSKAQVELIKSVNTSCISINNIRITNGKLYGAHAISLPCQ